MVGGKDVSFANSCRPAVAGLVTILLAGCASFPQLDVHQSPLPRHPPDHRSEYEEIGDGVARSGGGAANALGVGAKGGPATAFVERDVTRSVAMKALEAYTLLPFARYVFGEPHDVRISADVARNTLILTGEEREVATVSDLLRMADKPDYAGMHAALIEPEYVSVDSFAHQLEERLAADGIAVTRHLATGKSVTLVPHASTGVVFLMAGDSTVLDRLRAITADIDSYHGDASAVTTFVYPARNVDAAVIATALSAGGPTTGANPALGGSLMVDTTNNRILYSGTYANYRRVRDLLAQVDIKPKQVLIQAEIAEVSLNDETNFGLEWFFEHAGGSNSGIGGTKGGLGLAKTGFSYIFTGKKVGATFQAYASNNKVNLLSRPRVFVRSGSEATVQVGSDVPIITQVASTNIQNNGQSAILEQITYRQTGTILKIKPVVYGDRVDIQLSQEISAQQPDAVAAINSPVILKRSLTTTLSLTEGDTALLGGLIEDQYTKGNGGVPILKDIPILGQVFRADTVAGSKVDLILLLTPYIVDDSNDIADITNAFDTDMNRAFRVGRAMSYTLMPWSTGHNFGGVMPAVHPGDRGDVVEGSTIPTH